MPTTHSMPAALLCLPLLSFAYRNFLLQRQTRGEDANMSQQT